MTSRNLRRRYAVHPARPVIFLDVDGVLNSREWFELVLADPDRYEGERRMMLDPAAVARLAGLQRHSGAAILVISSWPMWGLRERLREGMLPQVALHQDLRPDGRRGVTVRRWLARFGFRGYAILDDDHNSYFKYQQLVRVDPNRGLALGDCDEALSYLTVAS